MYAWRRAKASAVSAKDGIWAGVINACEIEACAGDMLGSASTIFAASIKLELRVIL
jgi:hypothetical protein